MGLGKGGLRADGWQADNARLRLLFTWSSPRFVVERLHTQSGPLQIFACALLSVGRHEDDRGVRRPLNQ